MTNDNNISICSLNCQGLGDSKKRRDVINYLKNKQFSIICLQDTHFNKQIENVIRAEWGYKALFSSFSTNSRGTAIFFKNNFQLEIHNYTTDPRGNFIIVDLSMDDHRLTLANIYAPNNDEPSFFGKLENNIKFYGNSNVIIVGDWNLLLNPALDGKNYKHVNNKKARDRVGELISNLDLYDVWREEHPDLLKYTWKRKLNNRNIQMGRLDFFLVSNLLTKYICKEKILPGYRSDHSLITISVQFDAPIKTKTFWKFNNSYLKDPKYVQEVKETILKVKKQYAASPYDLNNISNIENKDYQSLLNPQLFFEMILLEIRSTSIAFGTNLKRNENKKQKDLENQIKTLENDPTANINEIQVKKQELQQIRQQELEGKLVRSRAKWADQGEKMTNFFVTLKTETSYPNG